MTTQNISADLWIGTVVAPAERLTALMGAVSLAVASRIWPKTSIATSFIGQAFMTPNDATSRLGKRATWNVGGVDQPNVNVQDFGNYYQLLMPGQAYDEEMYDAEGWPGFSFITPDDSWKRLVTIAPLTEAPYRIAVGPSFRAVEAQPELIAEPGTLGYDFFCGSNLQAHDGAGPFPVPKSQHLGQIELPPIQRLPAMATFLTPSTADLRLFYRYPVYDPDDLPTGGTQGTMFSGVGWYDFAPFTAEIDVFMAGERSPAEFAIDDYPNARFLIPQDNSPIAYVAQAVEAAKSLRDLTLLQPKPIPVFTAGKPFIVGADHYVIGQPNLSD